MFCLTAAEVLSNNDFSSWNDIIYSHLQSELALLEGERCKCIIIGDMNAHIGSPMESRFGISGNRDGINVNGLKFLLILSELMTWSSSIRRTSAQGLSLS